MRKIITCFILLISFSVVAERTKQALRAFNRGDFDRVEDILSKSGTKDSLNPATEYVWALLYSDTMYVHYNLDTAHMFIQLAVRYLVAQNEKHLDELDDADVYEHDLQNKKMSIDSIAFSRAVDEHSISRYNHFIELYSDAASLEEAVLRRDLLIFAGVESENTWRAYRQFIIDYPDSKQFEKARIQYDKLVFEDKTKSGDVIDFINFLKEQPETPYRRKIEKIIFEDYSSELDGGQIENFILWYDNPVLTKKALSMLYHLSTYDFEGFINKNDQYQYFSDSVKRLVEINKTPLIPLYNKKRYQFVDLQGTKHLDEFDDIDFKYLCGNVTSDWLEVKVGDVQKVIDREGHTIHEGYTGNVKELGNGLLAIELDGKYGLVHKSGFEILPFEYEDLTLLQDKLLVFKDNGKLGIMNISGKVYVSAIYDDIYLEDSFWVFSNGGRFGVSILENLLNAKNSSQLVIDLKYEEIELISKKYLIGYQEEREFLIDRSLTIMSPSGTKRINSRFETWFFDGVDGYQTFDPELGQLSNSIYVDIKQNREWLGLKRNGKWFVYNKNIYDEPIIGIDSLKLLGSDIAIVFRGESGMAIFPNKKVVDIVEDEYVQSIGSGVNKKIHFLVIKRIGQNILYKDGEELFKYKCDELGYISDSIFFVKKYGKYGAVGLDGKLIMRVRYDAIGEARDGIVDVLYRGKFGAYNLRDRIMLRVSYEEKVQKYNNQIYIIRDKNGFGLLGHLNQIKIAPEYEQIRYWSDTSFLAKRNSEWHIINMNSEKEELSNVRYYEYLKDTPKEKILLVRKEEGYGIYHSSKGMIVPTKFHDIFNLGNDEDQLYFTEIAISEAEIYVVVYYDSDGNKLSSESYRGFEYELLVCGD